MADDDAAIAQALAALDAQLPGKLINNPYDVKWSSYGPDKKDSIVKSEGAPGGEPYDSVLDERFAIGKEWKLYNASGTAKRDYAADKTNINFNLARAKQTLEFGQFYIMNLGPGADASKYMK